MASVTLIIDNQHISLGASVDIPELTAKIVNAVRDGGDFVHVNGAHGIDFDILVTPRTEAIIRTAESGLDTTAPDTGWVQIEEFDF